MGYAVTLLTIIAIFTILTASLDLILSYTGLFSFAHASLYGVGAYTAALIAMNLSHDLVIAFVAALVVTAIVALVTVGITLRMVGDYFIMGTVCVANVISSVMDNWTDVTNGANGLYGIPAADVAGFSVSVGWPMLVLAVVIAALALFIKWRITSAPLGIVLQAIRDDEVVASVLGHDATRTKVLIFTIAAGGNALAGTLLAYYLRFLDPTSFGLNFTIFVWAALFVGGSLSVLGSLAGPTLLVLFPEALRFVGLSGTQVANVQQALYGLLLILLILFRPQGLVGRRAFG